MSSLPATLPSEATGSSLTPREIVAELDKYVVGQAKAKRAVAIALRNRYRRQRLTPDLAEEVVQDVFAQVWREAGRYDASRSTVAGWMVMLTRTRAIDRLRARQARPDLTAAVDASAAVPLASAERTPESTTIVAEDTRLVRGALAQLPDQFRSLIELAYYEGLTHSEIAARTGIPLGTVKTRLRNAMGSLRSALA